MHTPSGTSLPVVPAKLAPVLPYRYGRPGAPAHPGPGHPLHSAEALGSLDALDSLDALEPPAPGAGIRLTSDTLPGLESVAPGDEESVWLHDALLGPHSADIVRYLSLARSTGGPVLDLGSGAGRLAVPFARHGFAVEAVDRDGPALERLESWARRIGPQVAELIVTTRADLTELRLDGDYRLALLAGAMVSAVPPHARPRLLREIASHLGAGGALALDYTSHLLPGLIAEPQRTWAFQVPRFDGIDEWVVARQVFDLRTMSERITYFAARTGKLSTERVVLTTDKWIVDGEHLAAELHSAGLHIEGRRRHRIDERTESVLLVCRPDD